MTSGCLPSDPLAVVTSLAWHGQEWKLASSHRPAPDGGGPLLLCIHGSYCNRSDFACVLACARLRHCGILAVDLPGHGDSSKIPIGEPEAVFPARLEDMAELLWELLVALGYRDSKILIVGHSLGGAVGLLLAAAQLRSQLCGFVSLEGCLVASDTPEHGIASRWSRRDARAVSALDLLEEIAAASHLGRDPVGLEHWREGAERCGPTVHFLAVRMSASTCGWCHSGQLPDCLCNIPAFHYVYGTASGKFSALLASTLHGRRNCHAHPVPGAGHFLLLESVEATLGIIQEAVADAAIASQL
mmetsp:Transcript_37931/g.80624  ORF Transcript_37931/g.80624 Transcript_37931/m.80624 type:complete len:301 (+) Transcript_37931:41-943(+)